MGCPMCRDLKRSYERGLSEYTEARSSASYGVSTRFAAFKNVEMERAKSELEEHRLVCACVVTVIDLIPELSASTSLKQLAA